MLTTDNAVLHALRDFPANSVYFLAPKKDVVLGFKYHEEQRLESYSWSKDATVLEANLRVDGLHGISFSVENSKLAVSCDCHWWKPGSHCAHVVGALLTTCNLLSPQLFPRRREDEKYRLEIERSLLAKSAAKHASEPVSLILNKPQSRPAPAESVPLEVILKNAGAESLISVRKGGRIVYFDYRLPKELIPLSYWHSLTSAATNEAFLQYLNQYAGKYPLILETLQGPVPLRWDPSFECKPVTQLDLLPEGVRVEALCLHEGKSIRTLEVLGHFVVDLGRKRLGILTAGNGWEIYRELMKLVKDLAEMDLDQTSPRGPGHIFIPMERFQQIQIVLPSALPADIEARPLLAIEGEPVQPEVLKPVYRLTIDSSIARDDLVNLIAECRVGPDRSLPPSPVFDFFVRLDQKQLPAPLRTQGRRAVMCEAFFRLAHVGNSSDGQKAIRQALAGSDVSRYRYRREAAELLRSALGRYLAREERLTTSHGQWVRIACDKQREMLLYQVAYLCFGPQIFRGMQEHSVMRVPAGAVEKQLPALHAQLEKHGIELFVNRKPVVSSRWDFGFDATHASGIDWFEIKPEIRCNGALLSEEQWLRVLEGSSVKEEKDEIQVLDAASREVLRAVAAVLQGSRASGRVRQEIVQVPRLQILDWISLRRHGVRVRLLPDDEALIDRLTHFERIEPLRLPAHLRAKLRPYQREGYYWLAFLYQHRLGACLADDMGLGKTLQAILLLGAIREAILVPAAGPRLGPHLLVLPPTLLFNWENELMRFYPGLKIGRYSGRERTTNFEDCDVVLTTYATVRKDIEKLKQVQFHVIVFDEAQAIKNIFASTTGAARQLPGYFKLALTGTPLENHLGEYYSILDLCLPGLMGNYDQFKSQMKCEASPATDLVIQRTRPFVLRRTKDSVLKELPPKTEIDVYLDLTEKQKTLYQQTVRQIHSSIDEAYRSKTQAQAQIIALTAILKLRQLCVSPRLLDRHSDERSPKIEFLIEKLKELRDEGHSALVFSQFTSFLDLLEEDLRSAQMAYSRLDGSTAVGKRKRLVEGFQKGEAASVFLLSLKAGGQGLNLTRASYVFHLDPWWNPAVENQASDRAHRIGQTRKVSITRILMRHTIEEKMMELKKRKLELYKAVMEESTHKGRGVAIAKEDFDFLLSV